MPDSSSISTVASALPYVHPLDDFYARAGVALPKIERITSEQMPEPYRSLLAHSNDMTPTLQKFHESEIHLRLLGREERGDFYFRQVVLQLDGTEQPVEFGAIKISLALFPPRARHLILAERVPLGAILKTCEVGHTTVAKAFFSLEPDELISRALNLTGPAILYGRRANILDSNKRPLSEIVEVLPPERVKQKPTAPKNDNTK
jgi:chorismate-pyruvate lyase